ncbi:MAG: ATP-binding protein [Myxococcales bacterium]|nr:ATP-binding protein [Myxococcales bacterium]
MKFTANVPGELRYRDLVGASLRQVCRQVESERAGVSLEWRLLSAFNEAFNNVVEHAYAERPGEVEVSLTVDHDRVVLRLVDQGSAFNFEAAGASDAPPEFDAMSEGGMGLFIMRQAMSEVVYERLHNRNVLTMMKRLSECVRASVLPSAPAAEGSRC